MRLNKTKQIRLIKPYYVGFTNNIFTYSFKVVIPVNIDVRNVILKNRYAFH